MDNDPSDLFSTLVQIAGSGSGSCMYLVKKHAHFAFPCQVSVEVGLIYSPSVLQSSFRGKRFSQNVRFL